MFSWAFCNVPKAQNCHIVPEGTNHISENSRRLWLSEILCWRSFRANFDAAGKFLNDVPAARNAIPAKVWALSGKENGCWKIGRAFGNAAGFSPPRPPQSTFLFQPQTVTPHKQHTPIEHLARGRLWVDSWSIFGQFGQK